MQIRSLLVSAVLLAGTLALPSSGAAVPQGSEGKIAFQRETSPGSYDIWVRDSRLSQCDDKQDNDLPGEDEEDGDPDEDVDWPDDQGCASLTDHSETQGLDTGLRLEAPLAGSAGTSQADPAWAPLECGSLACAGPISWSTAGSVLPLEQVLAFTSDRGTAGGPRDILAFEPSQTAPPAPIAENLTMSNADDGSPSFNRFGAMAFDSNAQGNRDIYVARPPFGPGSAGYGCPITSGPDPDSNPEWSPDGLQIAFERQRGGEPQLWVVDVDVSENTCGASGEPRLVTAGQDASSEPTWFDWDPAQGTPDTGGFAHRIAFAGPGERFDRDIHYLEEEYKADARPSTGFADLARVETWTLFSPTDDERGPSWSPHGNGLVFASNSAGNYDLYFLTQDGEGGPVQLTTSSANDLNPVIQPRPLADVAPRRVCGRACRLRRKRGRSLSGRSLVPPGQSEARRRHRCTVVGTPGNDRRRGTPRADVICGLGGDDLLIGGRGNDTIRGGNGRDRLLGGPGRDYLSGGPGGDRLSGGPGGDRLTGGPGRDRIFGGGGPDRVSAHDGSRDFVSGGPGLDSARLDASDKAHRVERLS